MRTMRHSTALPPMSDPNRGCQQASLAETGIESRLPEQALPLDDRSAMTSHQDTLVHLAKKQTRRCTIFPCRGYCQAKCDPLAKGSTFRTWSFHITVGETGNERMIVVTENPHPSTHHGSVLVPSRSTSQADRSLPRRHGCAACGATVAFFVIAATASYDAPQPQLEACRQLMQFVEDSRCRSAKCAPKASSNGRCPKANCEGQQHFATTSSR